MRNPRLLGRFGIAVLGCYGVFEIALACGAPLGRFAWGGADDVLPTGSRVASAAAALVYVALGVLLARGAGLPDPRPTGPAVRRGLFVAAGLFAVGVLMNLASPSPPERLHAVPALGLAVIFFGVARSTPMPARTH